MGKRIFYMAYFVIVIAGCAFAGDYFGIKPIWAGMAAFFLVILAGYKPGMEKGKQPKQKRNANPLIRMHQTDNDIYED